jgi:hypothetical protein
VAAPDDLVRLARAHQEQLLFIRSAAVAAVAALWDRLVTGPEDAVLERWVPLATSAVQGAQTTASAAAIGYVSHSVRIAGATPEPTPPEVTPSAFAEPRGVPTATVLARSIIQVRRSLGDGKLFMDAMSEGRSRAVQTAATEPVLSARAANQAAMRAQPRIVGYRRVPDDGACKFCLLASTRRYTVADLMPIHPGCGCTVAPIIGTNDPGEVLDRGLVDQLMASDPALGARGQNRETARRYAREQLAKSNELVTVHDHGELGPTLYQSGLQFTQA